MAIQQRRGADADFDSNKMLPGEFAVTTDGTRKAYAAFAPGDVREIAFKDQVPIVGNITPAEVQNAVNTYLTENPVQAGATEEQATQIERNRKNSELNKEEIAKTKNNLAQLSNPNIFINGNFQIWSNGESFQVQNKDTEVVTPVLTADKWYVESVDSTEVLNVNKVDDGLYISSSTPQECAIYQLLDDETYNAIKYKTLTLSYEYTQPYSAEDTSVHYETHKEVKQIVAEETLAWEFANNNAIRLPVGTVGGAGCTLHWVKLEVGELDTPCIPDSKDALICKLENEVTELNGNIINQTPGNSITLELEGVLMWRYADFSRIMIDLPFYIQNTNYDVSVNYVKIADIGDTTSDTEVFSKYHHRIILINHLTGTGNINYVLAGSITITFK